MASRSACCCASSVRVRYSAYSIHCGLSPQRSCASLAYGLSMVSSSFVLCAYALSSSMSCNINCSCVMCSLMRVRCSRISESVSVAGPSRTARIWSVVRPRSRYRRMRRIRAMSSSLYSLYPLLSRPGRSRPIDSQCRSIRILTAQSADVSPMLSCFCICMFCTLRPDMM